MCLLGLHTHPVVIYLVLECVIGKDLLGFDTTIVFLVGYYITKGQIKVLETISSAKLVIKISGHTLRGVA